MDGNAEIYTMMKPEDWYIFRSWKKGQRIEPISFTGNSKEFLVKMLDKDLKDLFDENGDIQHHNVLEWSLPNFS